MNCSKMFRALSVCLLALALFVPASWSAEGLKIGLLDVKRCMAESKKGARVSAEFKAKMEEADRKISLLEEEAKKISQEVERQQALMTDAMKEEKKKRFQAIREEAKQLSQNRKSTGDALSEAILKELQIAIDKFAEDNGYDLILTTGGPWLAYAKKTTDVTDAVIRLYDQETSTK